MTRLFLAAVICLTLAGCKTEQQRAHERHIQEQQQQFELQKNQQNLLAKIEIERELTLSQERLKAKQIVEVSIRAKQLLTIAGVLAGLATIVYLIIGVVRHIVDLLKKRLDMIREVRFKAEAEQTQRYMYFVRAIADPKNGMSDEVRRRALESASKAISGYLTYDPGAG